VSFTHTDRHPSRSTIVTRALDARAYPTGRPSAVAAPQRVGARMKSAHDNGLAQTSRGLL
jgi:hypothetical protein